MDKKYRYSDDFKIENAKPIVVVGVLPYDKSGRILIGTGEKFKGKWSLVGGHLDFGESLETGALRELKEETNLDAKNAEFLTILQSIGSTEYTMKKHFIFINYLALVSNPNKLEISDEFDACRWLKPQDALKLELNSSTRETIEAFMKKKIK